MENRDIESEEEQSQEDLKKEALEQLKKSYARFAERTFEIAEAAIAAFLEGDGEQK